jgi:hypothetical protein
MPARQAHKKKIKENGYKLNDKKVTLGPSVPSSLKSYAVTSRCLPRHSQRRRRGMTEKEVLFKNIKR